MKGRKGVRAEVRKEGSKDRDEERRVKTDIKKEEIERRSKQGRK